MESIRTPDLITGSHRNLFMFGAISLKGKQLFRIVEGFNEDTFYELLKYSASQIPVYLPTASPEFMVLEECRNISKNDLLIQYIFMIPFVLTFFYFYHYQMGNLILSV